jgi:hypothetical protein
MGNYSKSLSKRLRSNSNNTSSIIKNIKNDAFWDSPRQNLTLKKFKFEEKFSRQEWRRIQASHRDQTAKEADVHYDFFCTAEHWMSDDYWVVLDKTCRGALHQTFNDYPLWHLEISRRDETPIRDWQILQAIKNEVVGKQYEAVELYPAHSRLMDVHNKYHLWILAPKEGEGKPPRFPLGLKQHGVVSDKVIFLTQRTVDAYHSGEMSEEQQEGLRKLAVLCHVFVFPVTLRPDVEKEFPDKQFLAAMGDYVKKHPETDLEPFEG